MFHFAQLQVGAPVHTSGAPNVFKAIYRGPHKLHAAEHLCQFAPPMVGVDVAGLLQHLAPSISVDPACRLGMMTGSGTRDSL